MKFKYNDVFIYARVCGYLAFLGSGVFSALIIASVLFNRNDELPLINWLISIFLMCALIILCTIIFWSLGQLLFTLAEALKQSNGQKHKIAPHQPYSMKWVSYVWLQGGTWLLRILLIIMLICFIILFYRFIDFTTGYPYYCRQCENDPTYYAGGSWLIFMGTILVFGLCLEHIFRLSYRLFTNSHKNYARIITKYPQLSIRLKRNWVIIALNVIIVICTLGLMLFYISWFITNERIMLLDFISAIIVALMWFCVVAVTYILYLNQRSLMITRAVQQQLVVITKQAPPKQIPSFRRLQILAMAIGLCMMLVIIVWYLLTISVYFIFTNDYGYVAPLNLTSVLISTLIIIIPCSIILISFGEILLITRHLAREKYIIHHLL